MAGIKYYFVDVFAEQKYAGNQLAVFLNAGQLSEIEMQKLAREINFSESTFIFSNEKRDGGYNVRIFTPREEVPFAGHPTLGTAFVIREKILPAKTPQVRLNLKVGQIPVDFSDDGRCWMKQMAPVFIRQHQAQLLAGVLGLEASEIDPRFPVEEVSTGLPFFIVPLKTLGALKKAKVDLARYTSLIRDTASKGILVFCPQPHEPGDDLSVRVFVDYFGVPEDPATGSANGCLAGYLVKNRYYEREKISLTVGQGYEIGRPSRLFLDAEESQGKIEVRVGGRCIEIARGELS